MNLQSKYLGLILKSPLVVSASPLTEDLSNFKKMEDAGAAAVVMHSLFEEQLINEQYELHYHTTAGTYSSAESLSYFPDYYDYRLGPDEYLEMLQKAKSSVNIPIIASLNGINSGSWINYSQKIQEAGADALELNIYHIPTDLNIISEKVEQNYIDILKAVKSAVKIPVAIKIGPYFSNTANMAKKLDDAGANALVLFNRFYQADIDLENLEVKPGIHLSHSLSSRLPLTWIAILYGKIKADMAASTGIHTGKDVLKMLLAGANVTMLCSTIMKNGISYIKEIEKEMIKWLEEKEYDSVEQLRGSLSNEKISDSTAYERALYMKALTYYNN